MAMTTATAASVTAYAAAAAAAASAVGGVASAVRAKKNAAQQREIADRQAAAAEKQAEIEDQERNKLQGQDVNLEALLDENTKKAAATDLTKADAQAPKLFKRSKTLGGSNGDLTGTGYGG